MTPIDLLSDDVSLDIFHFCLDLTDEDRAIMVRRLYLYLFL
jgi:hypothetical protein